MTTPSPSSPAKKPPTHAELLVLVEERLASKRSSGLVVAHLEGSDARIVAHGEAGPGKSPIDGETIFEIGSLTKLFTATVISEMVGRNDLALDEPISTFLPKSLRVSSRAGRSITTLDLATQTSALPRIPAHMPRGDPTSP